MKKILLAAALLCTTTLQSAPVTWYSAQSGQPVTYSVSAHATVVDKALEMFVSDMKAVTGKAAVAGKKGPIAIYQLDQLKASAQKKLRKLGVPTDAFTGRLDAFWMGVRKGQVVIVGSNGRGTAYGILELSRQAGVSPWVWWGDVVPEKKDVLTLDDRTETLQRPSVDYRGVFINDEDWANRIWDHRKLDTTLKEGNMGPQYYRRLFQLLLRLRGNALWPAMHTGTTAFFKVAGNKEVADSFDICVGSSHCEPILRNNLDEWDEHQWGPYDFIHNREAVEAYWRERARETRGMDALYTIGMRGIHDGSMQGVKTPREKLEGLQAVLDCQRRLLSEEVNADLTKVPQVFIPYKEVLQIYEWGLKVPDDVMLMWCDDNYGYMTRLSDAEQQARKGGAGVYYHLSYWGRPHDYLWLTTIQPGLVYNEMRQAYDHNARRFWVVNVHDPKVAAYDLSLFMDMAWDINSITPSTIQNHLHQWLIEQFGKQAGDALLEPMTEYYHLTAIRHPEFMGWNQVELDKKKYPRGWSPVQDTEFQTYTYAFGNELKQYIDDYQKVKAAIDKVEPTIRPELRDAFFAAIKYPVYGAAAMAEKQLYAQMARQGSDSTTFHSTPYALAAAVKSTEAFNEIQQLTHYYNKVMAGGKWDGNMCYEPRDLYVFKAPTLPGTLTKEEIEKYKNFDIWATNDEDRQTAEEDSVMLRATKDSVLFIRPITRNAADWQAVSGTATPVEMLGHSMRAVALAKGSSLTYTFDSPASDSAVVYVAMIPTQANDKGDIRFAVTIDGQETVFSLKEPYRSERWKVQVLRGQALREIPVSLKAGHHTLTIRALDDHIIADQWMVDFARGRQFYVIPSPSNYLSL